MGGRGRGRGGGRGAGRGCTNVKDVEDLKKNLQESIVSAEAMLKQLELDEKKKRTHPIRDKVTRGSRSMCDLSSSAGPSNPRARGRGRGRGYNHQPSKQPRPLLPQPINQFYHPNPIFPSQNQARPRWSPGFHSRSEYPAHGNAFLPPEYFNGPPPPSYEESEGIPNPNLVSGKESRKKEEKPNFNKHTSRPKLSVDKLVKTLAIFRGQYEKVDTLRRHLETQPEEVIKCATSRKDLFITMGEGSEAMIELVPKIALCSEYFKEKSCNAKDICKNLHICKTFVTGFCHSGSSCEFGHRWDTNHNSKILSKFYLDIIPKETLHQVVKKLYKVNFKLKLCSYYNSGQGCKYETTCNRLHICKIYVLNSGKCTVNGCSLNHNIVDKQCSSLLKAAGVTLNESPRDILLLLISSMDESVEKEYSHPTLEKKKGKNFPVKDKEEEKSDFESESSSSDIDNLDNPKDKSNKKKKSKTVKSTDLIGNVVIPEICVFAIDDNCSNSKKGCDYLHAKSLFHWQVKKNEIWYNLRVFQSKKLERAYRDVYQKSVEMPALDKNQLQDYAKELLNILGTTSWKADFLKMTVTDNFVTYKIRRISTQSHAIFTHPKATVFEWYFKNDKGKWIKFDESGTAGSADVCNVSCAEIEKKYMSSSSSNMVICNGANKFEIEFSRMMLISVETGKEREIRRRPTGLAYQKEPVVVESQKSSLPSHWDPMPVDQTHALVQLDSKSDEYLDVASRIRLSLPTAFIVSIKRLQNPYLWRLLQFRKVDLSRRYDDNQLNMQKLFHGVNPRDTDIICKENFDWRQKETFKQDFGQGTYFSNSAAVGRSHCNPDEFGRIHMFLAQVIIGTVVKGIPSYTRPPPNPGTGTLFDTTVDDVAAPSVFVKYDKGEYYPEYIIEFY